MNHYAVIGQPVVHSLSPRIHSAFAKQTGADLQYEAIEIAPDELSERLSALHAQGYGGLNVTVPHKIAAAEACEALATRAQYAGAANTLIRTETGWRGDNTDGLGLVADLMRNLGVTLAGARVVVLGAGGAARGILAPLLTENPAELVISNRSPRKPETLAEQFKPLGSIQPRAHFALKGDRFDVVINATSAGHHGEMPRIPDDILADGALAYDLNYGEAAQPFLAWADLHGAARCSDGLGMLVEQAAESFELWRGRRPDTAPILTALRTG